MSLFLTLLLTPAFAAESPLDQLVGTFRGNLTFTADGADFPVEAVFHCVAAADDAGVACTVTATGIPGLDVYREADLWGYDAGTGQYHLYAITNTGDVHDHAGSFDGTTLALDFDATIDGAAFHEDVDTTFLSRRTLLLSNVITVDGVEVARLSGRLRR